MALKILVSLVLFQAIATKAFADVDKIKSMECTNAGVWDGLASTGFDLAKMRLERESNRIFLFDTSGKKSEFFFQINGETIHFSSSGQRTWQSKGVLTKEDPLLCPIDYCVNREFSIEIGLFPVVFERDRTPKNVRWGRLIYKLSTTNPFRGYIENVNSLFLDCDVAE